MFPAANSMKPFFKLLLVRSFPIFYIRELVLQCFLQNKRLRESCCSSQTDCGGQEGMPPSPSRWRQGCCRTSHDAQPPQQRTFWAQISRAPRLKNCFRLAWELRDQVCGVCRSFCYTCFQAEQVATELPDTTPNALSVLLHLVIHSFTLRRVIGL